MKTRKESNTSHDIIRLIHERAIKFEVNTGQVPVAVYLGDLEARALVSAVNKVNGRRVDLNNDTDRETCVNLLVYTVRSISHLTVTG